MKWVTEGRWNIGEIGGALVVALDVERPRSEGIIEPAPGSRAAALAAALSMEEAFRRVPKEAEPWEHLYPEAGLETKEVNASRASQILHRFQRFGEVHGWEVDWDLKVAAEKGGLLEDALTALRFFGPLRHLPGVTRVGRPRERWFEVNLVDYAELALQLGSLWAALGRTRRNEQIRRELETRLVTIALEANGEWEVELASIAGCLDFKQNRPPY